MKQAGNAGALSPTGNGKADQGLEWVRNNWTFVAAVAWTGYVDDGRGAVVVSGGTPPMEVDYVAAPVLADPQSQALCDAYDPRREVVLVIMRDGNFAAAAHLMEGVPNPPEAVVASPLERLRSNARDCRRTEAPELASKTLGSAAAGDIDPMLINDPLRPADVIVGILCPFCGTPFQVGDLTKWVCLGPANRREYGKARRGLPYMSRSPWPFHCDCGDPKGCGAAGREEET